MCINAKVRNTTRCISICVISVVLAGKIMTIRSSPSSSFMRKNISEMSAVPKKIHHKLGSSNSLLQVYILPQKSVAILRVNGSWAKSSVLITGDWYFCYHIFNIFVIPHFSIEQLTLRPLVKLINRHPFGEIRDKGHPAPFLLTE